MCVCVCVCVYLLCGYTTDMQFYKETNPNLLVICRFPLFIISIVYNFQLYFRFLRIFLWVFTQDLGCGNEMICILWYIFLLSLLSDSFKSHIQYSPKKTSCSEKCNSFFFFYFIFRRTKYLPQFTGVTFRFRFHEIQHKFYKHANKCNVTTTIFSSYNVWKYVRYPALISRQPGVITQFR